MKCMYIACLCSCSSIQLICCGISCFLYLSVIFSFFFLMHLLQNFLDHCGKFNFHSDILSYVLIERERFCFYFSQYCPYSGAFQPFLSSLLSFVLNWMLKITSWDLLVFLLFLDPLNFLHIESELIGIIQVWLNWPKITKLREHLMLLPPFLS